MKAQVETSDIHMSNVSGEGPHHDIEATNPKEAAVEDSMAKGYVDPTLQLDEAENARLVKKIHWQYVLYTYGSLRDALHRIFPYGPY
jgi:hypothetical protein